jgi:hypothetical protein
MKFEVGKTYSTRSLCQNDCVISVKIKSRTVKKMTVEIKGQIKNVFVSLRDNVEFIKSFGSYSMAPIIRAS